jgi:excisionase family DNA binding protein
MNGDFNNDWLNACKLIARMARIGNDGDGAVQNIFSIKGACRYLSIGETTFRELVSEGEIPKAFKIGGCHRWHRKDLDAYIRRVMELR